MNDTTTTIVRELVRQGGNRAFEPRPIPQELFGMPMFFIWNLIFILILAVIFYWLVKGRTHPHETPEALLKKKYINGEIGKEKYEEMKKVISE